VISLGPVLVLVFPKKAKKPDWTGLLNTTWVVFPLTSTTCPRVCRWSHHAGTPLVAQLAEFGWHMMPFDALGPRHPMPL